MKTSTIRFPAWPTAHLLGLLVILIISGSSSAKAITIYYESIDLPDAVIGNDRFQYRYTVTDAIFGLNDGFTIYFALDRYQQLQNPPPFVNPDWEVISVQPDPGLFADGFYDGLSLVSKTDGASLDGLFILDFTWTGSGTPGSQPYDVHGPNFAPVMTGDTVFLPEVELVLPGILIFGGLVLILARRNGLAF